MKKTGIEPVTVVVSRRVRPGREADYEAWLTGVVKEAAKFHGHLGANVFRPTTPGEPYVLVYKFDSGAHLDAWTHSDVRMAWIKAAEEMTTETQVEQLSGLETWFTLPGASQKALIPPPKWKMAVITATSVFVLGQLIGPPLHHALDGKLPGAAVAAISVSITVPLLTWVVLPAAARVLRRWLYPPP